MGIRTVIRNGQIITEQASGANSGEGTFSIESPLAAKAIEVETTDFTAVVDNNKVYTLSGSLAVPGLTGTLPAASSTPGCIMTFRATSQHVHRLTCSLETAGVRGFSLSGTLASAVTFGATTQTGHSVSFISDGNKYMLFAASGSVNYAS